MAATGKAGRVSTYGWALRSIAVLLGASAMALGPLAGPAAGDALDSGTPARPFSEDSPWRQTIGANPAIEANSAQMIASVVSEPALNANLVEFGIPIHNAYWDTRPREVNCAEFDWGTCPFDGQAVFIPDGAEPSSGSDGALVTLHGASGKIFEFWQAEKSGDEWSASWGAVNSLDGSGWGGSATGSGASRLAGVIRVAEMEAGYIPHALALQTNNACTTFKPPALKSDGTSTRADCIPQGARLQLDPALNLSELDLTPGEMTVAKAMQRYGGYIVDSGGTPLSVSFEVDAAAEPGTVGAAYEAVGFRWDYDAMEQVPWDQLRVLK